MSDLVNDPPHYTAVVPGIEMTDVAEHFGFCLGNVIKYVWRAGAKGDPLEDLRKARWYLDREIANIEERRAEMRQGMLADLGLDLDNVRGTIGPAEPRRPQPGARVIPFRPRPRA